MAQFKYVYKEKFILFLIFALHFSCKNEIDDNMLYS